ncbi:MAG: hypothetical protein E6559_00285 [Pantoea sp.]|uniref:hypothetical protein n=1 Tax=Erwiniaceae TaxID=1903409 RepID=UPI002896FFAA|nr:MULTISPECIES: hypothetical protein [Pantoea]MDU5836251.1 hypothetical protein [Pantoea sp.]MDU6438347.1 hypothetical protein [Pantoea sp.]
MTTTLPFYIALSAFAASAFIFPRVALKQGMDELVKFQFLCTSAVAFIAGSFLISCGGAHQAFSFAEAVVMCAGISSADSGLLLWRNGQRQNRRQKYQNS